MGERDLDIDSVDCVLDSYFLQLQQQGPHLGAGPGSSCFGFGGVQGLSNAFSGVAFPSDRVAAGAVGNLESHSGGWGATRARAASTPSNRQHLSTSSTLQQAPSLSNNSADSADYGPDDEKKGKERAEAIQEKNRRAQKRFRERQKAKMKEMKEQLEELGLQVQSLQAENSSLVSRNNILEKLLALRTEEPHFVGTQQAQNFTRNTPWQSKNTGLEDWRGFNKPSLNTVECMADREVIGGWKEFVQLLANLLFQLDTAPNPDAVMQRLTEVAEQAGSLCIQTAVLNPLNIKKLVVCNVEDEESHGRDVASWQKVADSLGLTAQQRIDLQQLRSVYLAKLQRVQEARVQINTRVQMGGPHGHQDIRTMGHNSLKTTSCVEDLRGNMGEERQASLEFVSTFFKHVLRPIQFARLAVHSYPSYPDSLAIANCLAAEDEAYAASLKGHQLPEPKRLGSAWQ